MKLRVDQVAELEIMLDDHGVSGVLDAIADALERKAVWYRRPNVTLHPSVRSLEQQAAAIRAQAQALATGRYVQYATQAPLGL
jgi:predicted transcriptional regulator